MADDALLSVGGNYNPFILSCGRISGRQRGLRLANAYKAAADWDNSAYRLVHFFKGDVKWGGGLSSTVFPEGSVVLFQPGASGLLHVPPGGQAIQVYFDVIKQPRQMVGARRSSEHTSARRQPLPDKVWGTHLPLVVPPQSAAQASVLLVRISSTFWRSAYQHFHANAELAMWIARFIAFLQDYPVLPIESGAKTVSASLGFAATALSHRVTVEDMAQASQVSRVTFHRNFQQKHEGTPAAFLRSKRMARALELLKDPSLSIAEVGRIVGYTSPAAFCHAFKKAFGQTPSMQRKELKAKD